MKKLAAAVAAVSVCILSAGCAVSGRPAAAGRPSSGSPASVSVPADQLTVAAARRVSSRWLAGIDQLSVADSPGAAAQLMTGEALQTTLLDTDGTAVPTTSQPTDQSVFVPVQAGYPRWFVQTERFPDALFSTYMMFVFVQAARHQPWKAALLGTGLKSDPYRQMTEISRDSRGYAKKMPVADSALAIEPANLPAAWASLYNQGITAANSSRLIQPNDVYFVRYLQNLRVSNGRKNGFVESASQTPGNLPVYALATVGGGALVIFTTINTVNYVTARTATITDSFDQSSGIPEPPWMFRQNVVTVPAGTHMSQVTAFVLVAIDPARSRGPVDVISLSQFETAFSPATAYAASQGQ